MANKLPESEKTFGELRTSDINFLTKLLKRALLIYYTISNLMTLLDYYPVYLRLSVNRHFQYVRT
jgi:hypothetical protein